jgi:hypothetical protein
MNAALTAERLRELLDYNPATGHFTWRAPPRNGTLVGDLAGSSQRGYIQINVDNSGYLAHRLVWLYVHGRWPISQIDHINLIQSDNRLANLREATHAENARNCEPLSIANKSGYRGVYWNTQKKKWEARIRVGGPSIYLGRYNTKEEAAAAYRAAAIQYHGAFARPEPINTEEKL